MRSFGVEVRGGGKAGVGWAGSLHSWVGRQLICSGGLNSRFLRIPRGKITEDKGSRLEQLESQERNRMDFKEEVLEVSL